MNRERINTVVIGGGQAGLSVGYHLQRKGVQFVILDASARVGDAWRNRWDSLRLFTPAKFSGLDGMRFPAPPNSFPTKDAMGDYLERYAGHFQLPVRSGVSQTSGIPTTWPVVRRLGTTYMLDGDDAPPRFGVVFRCPVSCAISTVSGSL